MRTLFNISWSIALLGLGGGKAFALMPEKDLNPQHSEVDFKIENIIAQVNDSPYEQLIQTGSCVGCNLSNLDLQGLDLSGANLQDANLSNANLSNSNLRQANLTGANLYLSNFSASDLSQANFSNVTAKSANFTDATLRQSSFQDTIATYSNFSNADFSDASIDGSNFSDSNLASSNFTNASISDSNFNFAILDQSDLSSARFSNSSLLSASTTGTTLPIDDISSETDAESTVEQVSSSDQVPEMDKEVDKEAEKDLDTDTTVNESESISDPSDISPLHDNLFPQATASHLKRGDLVFGLTNRMFFLSGSTAEDGTAAYPNVNIDWGITNTTELGASLQIVDTGSPNEQGPFFVSKRESNRDYTLELKQRIWESNDEKLAISAAGALAAGDRSYTFRGFPEEKNKGIVPSLQIPITATLNDRLKVTLSPTVAFFPAEHALFLRRPPLADPGSFGTNIGLAGSLAYRLNPRLSLWGDAFVPFVGQNSLNIATGRPAKNLAFNVGTRFLVNPRLGIDLFASNTFGSRGPLALTADRNATAFGAGLTFLPSVISSNRKYNDSFNDQFNGQDTPLTVDGIGFFDGGTVPSRKFLASIQGGQQGILSSLRYGVLKDLEAFVYLDYVFGEVDESEQGFGLKFRVLNQAEKAPLTVSAAVSVGQTNEPFINFFENNRNEFNDRGLNKSLPFVAQTDNGPKGRLFLLSASLPIHYEANDQLNFWFTPSIGYAQRLGIELAGFNAGGSYEVIPDLSVVAEVGANFAGNGNAFGATKLVDRIPWTFALRWDPSSVFNISSDDALVKPNFEVYVTNRVGSSIWNQMRVREGSDPAVGVGVAIPF